MPYGFAARANQVLRQRAGSSGQRVARTGWRIREKPSETADAESFKLPMRLGASHRADR